MRLVQCFLTVLMLPAHWVLSSPVTSMHSWEGSNCKVCRAGEYQKSCTVCEPCPPGQYTRDWNSEDSCHRCFSDCRRDFHLKIDQNCTRTSDLKCNCEDGFICSERVHDSENCRSCEKIQHTTVPPSVKQTPSSERGSTSTQPCRFPKCVSKPVSAPENGTHPKTGTVNNQLAAILCPMVAIGCVIGLVILFCIRRPGDETCFKQTIEKLWSEGGKDASHKANQCNQIPTDSFSAKQQPSSMSTAGLGQVHVYNPGTVIFSLLNHFTNQVSPTGETEKAAERAESSEEEDERDCPVFHPTSSPSIHLSEEEERRGDTDSIFFPSQEQGKDFHVSKEEGS